LYGIKKLPNKQCPTILSGDDLSYSEVADLVPASHQCISAHPLNDFGIERCKCLFTYPSFDQVYKQVKITTDIVRLFFGIKTGGDNAVVAVINFKFYVVQQILDVFYLNDTLIRLKKVKAQQFKIVVKDVVAAYRPFDLRIQ